MSRTPTHAEHSMREGTLPNPGEPLRINDRIQVFGARTPDGRARILKITPYAGTFTKAFNVVLTLEVFGADGFPRGTIELDYNDEALRKLTADLTFSVLGAGDFPVDMLRYDQCEFASDAERAAALGTMTPSTHMLGRRSILMRFTGDKRIPSGRWASFGWTAVGYDAQVVTVTASQALETCTDAAQALRDDRATLQALLREGIRLMPLGTAVRGDWILRATEAVGPQP
jgi:hypothetical protein